MMDLAADGKVGNARIEHDKALARVMTAVLKDDTELFKQFTDNESFRRWMTDTVFGLTYGLLQIVGERPIVRREHLVGQRLSAYLLAKVTVLLPFLLLGAYQVSVGDTSEPWVPYTIAPGEHAGSPSNLPQSPPSR